MREIDRDRTHDRGHPRTEAEASDPCIPHIVNVAELYMCKHSIVDHGICYYCGERVGKSGPEDSRPMNSYSHAPGPSYIQAVFGVEHLGALKAIQDALADSYSIATGSSASFTDDERNQLRTKYREAMDLIVPLVNHLKDIKYGKKPT